MKQNKAKAMIRMASITPITMPATEAGLNEEDISDGFGEMVGVEAPAVEEGELEDMHDESPDCTTRRMSVDPPELP